MDCIEKHSQKQVQKNGGIAVESRLDGIDSAGAVKPFDPVALTQIFDPNPATGAWCMNELIVAKINANVRERTAHGIEKHKITWLEFVFGHNLPGIAHFPRAAWKHQSEPFTEDMADKTRAVETRLGGTATTTVANA